MTETLKNNKPSRLNHTELDFILRLLYDFNFNLPFSQLNQHQ